MSEKSVKKSEFLKSAEQLIKVGKMLYKQGMVAATSGNFSMRQSNGHLAITTAKSHKGFLTPNHIMLTDASGNSMDGKVPSREALLHVQIYDYMPDARCVLHPHSVNATLLSMLGEERIMLRDFELLKAFNGLDENETVITLPVFDNDMDFGRLADKICEYMDQSSQPLLGYLVRGHGLYTWGNTAADAIRHVEAFEFLFNCEIKMREISRT